MCTLYDHFPSYKRPFFSSTILFVNRFHLHRCHVTMLPCFLFSFSFSFCRPPIFFTYYFQPVLLSHSILTILPFRFRPSIPSVLSPSLNLYFKIESYCQVSIIKEGGPHRCLLSKRESQGPGRVFEGPKDGFRLGWNSLG